MPGCAVLAAACGSSGHTSSPATAAAPVSTSAAPATTAGAATTTTAVAPAPTTEPGSAPTTVVVSSAPATTVVAPVTSGTDLPVSVESDAAMRAAGNAGPSSSILVPSSCRVSSSYATATDTYQGGMVPEIYPRSGDIIDLYVFSAAQPGYPAGIQLASPSGSSSPRLGGTGSWTVTVPIQSQPAPARCEVAAQPTHDVELAPSSF